MKMNEQRTKIAYYLPNLMDGGIQRAALANTRGLVGRGYEVDLVVCRAEGRFADDVPEGANVVALQRAPLWRARLLALTADPGGFAELLRPVLLAKKPSVTLDCLPSLVRYLKTSEPRALISAIPSLNVEALLARRLAGVSTRSIVTEQGSFRGQKTEPWRWRYLPPLIRRTYAWADSIVAVSDALADDLTDLPGLPRERIITIFNPVAISEVQENAKKPLAHSWFAEGEPPVVLAVGRITREKDYPTLLRAFVTVRSLCPARLMIVGEDGNKENPKLFRSLIAMSHDLGLADDVCFTGFVESPYPYMARARLFVLSSRAEGLPTAMIEAMACGCPVVSTDCPTGPREILENGKLGSLAPVGDDAALAQAIVTALDTPPHREQLRARAAMFSVESALNRYEALF